MTITITPYDTATLLGVYYNPDIKAPPSYFRDLAFPNELNFDDEFVDFGKIDGRRPLAPLVVPTAQGKPIYTAAERSYRVKPAYVKPKDPVTASRMIKRVAGFGDTVTRGTQSPQERYDAVVADILKTHREAIDRRLEWMAAQAVLYGLVTLEDEAYPKTLVDFGRDAGNSVTLGSGARWGDSGVNPIDNIESWRDTMRGASFGGGASRITMGRKAWAAFRNTAGVIALLDTTIAGDPGLRVNRGLRSDEDVELVGQLRDGLPIYVYTGFYQTATGTSVDFMDSRDVLLTGPNLNGVQCFGAIQDIGAQFQVLKVFPKQWNQEDPSATFIMSQSAPLMVPVNPNNSFRVRVVA